MVGQVLAVPWARVVLLTVFAEGASIFGAFAFMVTHLHQAHGISLALAGQVVMLFGLGGLLFAVSVRHLVPTRRRGLMSMGCGLLVAVSYVVVALFNSLVVEPSRPVLEPGWVFTWCTTRCRSTQHKWLRSAAVLQWLHLQRPTLWGSLPALRSELSDPIRWHQWSHTGWCRRRDLGVSEFCPSEALASVNGMGLSRSGRFRHF